MTIVKRAVAMQSKTSHQFIRGVGYLQHADPPDIPAGVEGGRNCSPPAGTEDGSVHVLNPSHGAPQMRLRWIAREGAWEPLKPGAGNRLAWTADHLSRAGWQYVGLARDEPPADKAKTRHRR
jgi:hypothetical protein